MEEHWWETNRRGSLPVEDVLTDWQAAAKRIEE